MTLMSEMIFPGHFQYHHLRSKQRNKTHSADTLVHGGDLQDLRYQVRGLTTTMKKDLMHLQTLLRGIFNFRKTCWDRKAIPLPI